MKRWRIAPSDTPLSPAVVAHVVAGVGTPHLAANFLEAMHRVLPVTFCTVFAVGASGRLETVSAASSYGDTAERTASRYIAERFDRSDPHMLWLGARALPATSQRWVGHHRGDELIDDAYRAACYGDVGIRERASVLLLQPSGQRTAVSFYRSLAQPEFGNEDFAQIQSHAALLAEAAAAHGRVVAAAQTTVEAPLALPLRMLTQREQEVITHLLTGCTAKQTAQRMALSLATVRTHQYRAYRRLGIRTLSELLRSTRLPTALPL